MKNRTIPLIIMMLLLTAVLIYPQHLSKKGQNFTVRIDQIIADKYPLIEAYISVVDNENKPVLSLVPGNFLTSIDGRAVSGKTKIEGFQYTDEGVAYAVIFSSNGLMTGGPIAQQQKATLALFEALRPQDTFSLYMFGEEVVASFEFEKKDDKLLDKIDKVDVLGYNPHLFDVLSQTARKMKEAPLKRKAVIIMTDGREVGSKYNKDQMLSIVDDANIPVYSLGIRLMAGQNLHRIDEISEHTGGGYLYSPSVEKLPENMLLANDQIRMGYVLKFKVTHVKGDDQIHQMEVKVNYKGDESTFYKNFFARKVPMPLWIKILILAGVLLVIVALIIVFIILRRNERKRMGITKRKCPDCKRRMKDDWDECVFCKYLPPKKKKKKEFDE